MRRIGEACSPAIPAADDFVHYDFTLANLLSDGTAITGVIDVNPPVLAGDRAFDLATLLFYLYDQDDIRDPLRARLLELADRKRPARTSRTWCCVRSTGRCASTPKPRLPGITCTWPGSSPLTSTTAAQRNGLDSTHSPRRSALCGLQVRGPDGQERYRPPDLDREPSPDARPESGLGTLPAAARPH